MVMRRRDPSQEWAHRARRAAAILRATAQMETYGDDLSYGRGVMLAQDLASNLDRLAHALDARKPYLTGRTIRRLIAEASGYMQQLEAWGRNVEAGLIHLEGPEGSNTVCHRD